MRTIHGALVSVLAMLLAAPAHADGGDTRSREGLERMKSALQAATEGDCRTALKRSRPVVERPQQSGLPEELIAVAYHIAAACEIEQGNKKSAYAHALAGTALDDSTDELWQLRLQIEANARDFDATIATIEAMTQGRGRALNALPIRSMWFLVGQLEADDHTDLRKRLLAVLANAAYVPEEPFASTDAFRLRYARLLAQADPGAARALVLEIRAPEALAEASVDRQLRTLLPADIDVRAAAEARLRATRELVTQYPHSLEGLIQVSADLRLLGRPREALDVLETAVKGLEDPEAYEDRDEQLAWWWNERASNYAALGKAAEMVDSLRKGGALNEDGQLNVSQIINLAGWQIQFGQGDEALKTLAAFDGEGRNTSPYGEMQMRSARGCAHSLTGQTAKVAEDLTFVSTHEKDSPDALIRLLLCTGDRDTAATVLIRKLDNSEQRAGSLLRLSDYDEPPVKLPPSLIAQGYEALKQRPDVKAAIERAGGTRRFNVQGGEF